MNIKSIMFIVSIVTFSAYGMKTDLAKNSCTIPFYGTKSNTVDVIVIGNNQQSSLQPLPYRENNYCFSKVGEYIFCNNCIAYGKTEKSYNEKTIRCELLIIQEPCIHKTICPMCSRKRYSYNSRVMGCFSNCEGPKRRDAVQAACNDLTVCYATIFGQALSKLNSKKSIAIPILS